MAMSPIRPMTVTDETRIRAAAKRFCQRHNIEGPDTTDPATDLSEYVFAIYYWCDNQEHELVGYYRNLWRRAFRRAVREPRADTYGWGFIGYHVA